jgi:choline dehydrogenase-like flavoprotein
MGLAPSDHGRLRALAEAALPAGTVIPAAGERSIARLIAMLDRGSPAMRAGYAALLRSLDLAAYAMFGGPFARLSPELREEVLAAFERREAGRGALRALLAPLKLAHFDDPAVFESLGCRYALDPPKTAERARWREQVTDADALDDGETLECDVVVVGTGAGGAPIAYELARRGHAVMLVEEGPLFTREEFTGRAVDMVRKMYRDSGLTIAWGNTGIPIPIGRGVGGTTLINSGTCFRVPDHVFKSWRDEGLHGFTPDAMAEHYEQVERELEVAPSSAAALGKPAELIARGCDALGYSHHALARNAPGCDGQGLCCFGCPTDAKRSTNVSYVPKALGRGAQLVTGLAVDAVLTERGTAVGVSGFSTHKNKRVTVRARAVVIACGSLMTPALLLRNGLANNSGELGRNLSIHPASAAIALFDEAVHPARTVPQGYAIDAFAKEGLYFEGSTTPLDITAASLSGHGARYVSLMERFENTLSFGFMVKDQSRGRVSVGRDGKPRVRYWLNDRDLGLVQKGFSVLARVFFAAGAREVHTPVSGFERFGSLADVERFEAARIAARQVDLSAYHPLGTARMGVDPLRSVVDATHETHDVHNLFVSDGSVMPSSLGVNPQVTIMAMALRAAGFVDRRLSRVA